MMRYRHWDRIVTGVCAAVLGLSGTTGRAEPRPLADFREIVVADTPLPCQQAAADELALYVGRIVGTAPRIVRLADVDGAATAPRFLVGNAVAQAVTGLTLGPWQQEEWLLRSVAQGLIVAGDDAPGDPWSIRTRAGSMLAVYVLLEDHLGVRWFWPGPFGEHVPVDPAASVPELNLRQTPRFMIRSVQLGYGAYQTKTFRNAARQWARRSRLGWTRSAVFGHSWFSAFNLRNDESLKAHPEWFALVDGQRRGPQMCTTHPEVIERMVEYVLNGKQDIMNISPSDGGGFCECTEETKSETHKRQGIPSCTSLDVPGVLAYDGRTTQLSDRIFTYANTVARRVREKNPDKGCGMFAYTYYNKPPVRLASLEPNLYLSFVYQCASHRDPEAYRSWHEAVAGWQKFGTRMVVREGWGNHYYLDLPFLHYEQIVANLAEAARLGFIAAYGDGSKCFATQAPNLWAITHMMWDPERDGTALMNDFWNSAYGPAAAEIKAFFGTYAQALDNNWAKRRRILDTVGIAYVNLINSWHLLLPPDVVDAAEKHLVAAEAKALPGEYADRVGFHRFGHDYTRVMLEALDCYRRLAELGLDMDFFSAAVDEPRRDGEARQKLLQRAYELGEIREDMLLAHRDWAAMNEGLYAFTNDRGLRQWHATVKRELDIERPTRLTKASLAAMK